MLGLAATLLLDDPDVSPSNGRFESTFELDFAFSLASLFGLAFSFLLPFSVQSVSMRRSDFSNADSLSIARLDLFGLASFLL